MTFAQSWQYLVEHWYPGDPFQPSEAVHRYYETKWRIVEQIRPGRILEVGVRAGYSAYIMMRASPRQVRYLGIDNGLCDMEARREYLAHARLLLEGMDARLWITDAYALRAFPMGPDGDRWDLVHVDGDHSYDGCLHDITCAARVGRRILIDDYDTGEDIRRACEAFRTGAGAGEWGMQLIPDGLAGNCLFERMGK